MFLLCVFVVFSVVVLMFFFSLIVFGQDEFDVVAGLLIINWDDFLFDGEMEELVCLYVLLMVVINVDYFGVQSEQIGMFNVVEELIGEIVCLFGFVLLLDVQIVGEVIEFFFVFYVGVCVYMLLLLFNQIVYVLVDWLIMIECIWELIWVIGLLIFDQIYSGLGSIVYIFEFIEVEFYEY